jgi:hypothetical protein
VDLGLRRRVRLQLEPAHGVDKLGAGFGLGSDNELELRRTGVLVARRQMFRIRRLLFDAPVARLQ